MQIWKAYVKMWMFFNVLKFLISQNDWKSFKIYVFQCLDFKKYDFLLSKHTGFFIMIDKKSEFIARARKIHLKGETGVIFFIGHKHFDIYPPRNTRDNQYLSIFEGFWGALMVKIFKKYWKLTIMERHFHFVNISVTKTQILMKF